MKHAKGISSLESVEAIEKQGIDSLPRSTYEMIKQGAAINPDAPALTFFMEAASYQKNETWRYRELMESIHQTANFFSSLGAKKNTVIAYILPNLPETHFVIWGGQAAGTIAAINPLLDADAYEDLLNASEASILVTLAPFPNTDLFEKVQKVLPRLEHLKHLVLVSLSDRVRGIKSLPAKLLQAQKTLKTCGLRGIKSKVPDSIQVHDFNKSISRQPKNKLNFFRHISAKDYASFFCTGGTTGTPKIAMRTHKNEVFNAWSAAQTFGPGIGRNKTLFCGLPLFHVNGVLVTGLVPFSKGAHVILGTPQGYRGEGIITKFWEMVFHFKINFFSGVPTLYSSLLDEPIGHHDIRSLEYGLCGAAPMPVEVFRLFQANTGIRILEGYGLTEGTCVSSTNPPFGDRRLGSIGLRVPGQLMKTVLLDDSQEYVRDCHTNEIGTIIISGPNVFSGYKVEEHNKDLWVELDDGRKWLNTGDLGRQDLDGYFWLTGRKKELIIRGGHNIDPAMIEEPLHRHPAVQVAAAVGRPDTYAGELPVVYVQVKPGSSVTTSELLEFSKKHISERAAIPKSIRIVDQIPLTGVGKIFKPALKKSEIKSALGDALEESDLRNSVITVTDDKSKGMIVNVALDEHACDKKANEILGQFSIQATINVGSHVQALAE